MVYRFQRLSSYHRVAISNRGRRGATLRNDEKSVESGGKERVEGGRRVDGVTRYKVLVRLLIMHFRAR